MNTTRGKTAFLTTSSVLAILVLAPSILNAAQASAPGSYSFNLMGPNTALAQNNIPGTPIAAGDVLRLTGSGTFDTSAGTASGGGSFTHYKSDGSVFAMGTWAITGLQSFTAYGGPNPGTHGGVLLVTVTLFGPDITFAGLTLQVSSGINSPSNAPLPGTTLPGLFSIPTSGTALFHTN